MIAAPDLPPAYRLVALDEVDSTNAELRRRAAAGAEQGTLVWARRQSAGRGRRGRVWSSPPGNLYCSLLLRPARPPAEVSRLCFVAALAVGEAISALLPAAASVAHKWPNDVLVGGRKVAGILLESATVGGGIVDWVIVGVGVNVARHPDDTSYAATSLAAEGAEASVPDVLGAYVGRLDPWLGRWREEGFAPVRQAWLECAEGLGRPLEVRLARETLSGIFAELDMSGALVLATAGGGRRTVSAGEVFFPPDPGAENQVE